MAYRWTDGLHRYAALADLDLNYTRDGTLTFSTTGGLNNGPYVESLAGNNRALRRGAIGTSGGLGGVFSSGDGLHFACLVRFSALPSADHFFIFFGTNVHEVNGEADATGVGVSSTGEVLAFRHGGSVGVPVVLARSGAGAAALNTWYLVEVAAKLNTSGNGGYYKVWMFDALTGAGGLVINFSGTTASGTVPTNWNAFAVGSFNGSGPALRHANYIAWDEQGTDYTALQATTAYLPIIETLSIDAVDSAQFTPSAGNNDDNVDDPAFHDGDSTYNQSDVIGQVDQFTVTNMSSTPAYVFGVVVKTTARFDAPAMMQMRSRLISGATTSEGADRTMAIAYAQWADFWGKDPNTSAVWAVSQPDNIKVGYEFQA